MICQTMICLFVWSNVFDLDVISIKIIKFLEIYYKITFAFISGLTSVKLVSLEVPARVRKGSEVQLSCLYDLGNASLYSLKWFYRNHNDKNLEEQEFFRYTPRGKPIKQVFPLDGINVDVSLNNN